MLKSLLIYLENFFRLFYPSICCACGNHLYEGEECICVSCRMSMPYTFDENLHENSTYKVFLGRVRIKAASSLFYFKKKSRVQNLLHQLKYKNHEELGKELGKMHSYQMINSELFNALDYVVPVPLHPEKFKKRGYNQATLIAIGYAEGLNIDLREDLLKRKINTNTQTNKTRFERYENMESVFECSDFASVIGKNILLVDDVITTGSTIESCATTLINAGASNVYIASIALA